MPHEIAEILNSELGACEMEAQASIETTDIDLGWSMDLLVHLLSRPLQRC